MGGVCATGPSGGGVVPLSGMTNASNCQPQHRGVRKRSHPYEESAQDEERSRLKSDIACQQGVLDRLYWINRGLVDKITSLKAEVEQLSTDNRRLQGLYESAQADSARREISGKALLGANVCLSRELLVQKIRQQELQRNIASLQDRLQQLQVMAKKESPVGVPEVCGVISPPCCGAGDDSPMLYSATPLPVLDGSGLVYGVFPSEASSLNAAHNV